MARNSSSVNPGARILGLFMLILGLIALGAFMFDFLGLWDIENVTRPVGRLLGLVPDEVNFDTGDPLLLEDLRYQKNLEALNLQRAELEALQSQLDEQAAALDQRAVELENQELALAEREKALNDRLTAYDNIRNNLVQNARYLQGMAPAQAVAIMDGYEDQMLVDTLRVAEELAAEENRNSPVANWLQLMDPTRAATIQQKMAVKPN